MLYPLMSQANFYRLKLTITQSVKREKIPKENYFIHILMPLQDSLSQWYLGVLSRAISKVEEVVVLIKSPLRYLVVLRFSFIHCCVPIVITLYRFSSISVTVGAGSSYLYELYKKINCIETINNEHFSRSFIK
jgi:hypothetical protein